MKTYDTTTRRQKIQRQEDRKYNGKKTDDTTARRQTIQRQEDRRYNGKKTDDTTARRKRTKQPTIVYKALLRKLMNELYEPHSKLGAN